jgi:hypothetical protein
MEDTQPDFPAMKPNKYPWNDEVMKVLEMEPYTVTYRSPEGREFKFNDHQITMFLIEMWGKLDGWLFEDKGTFIPVMKPNLEPHLPLDFNQGNRIIALMRLGIEARKLKRKNEEPSKEV